VATRQDVNAPLLITIGAISAILVLVIVIGVTAWFMDEKDQEIATKYENAPNVWLSNLRLEQQTKLNGERWIDRDKKIIQIPIDRAMELIVQNGGKMPSTQPAGASASAR
jgi:hypothetical protein